MTLGTKKDNKFEKRLDDQGSGMPHGELEGKVGDSPGTPGRQHWQAGCIGKPGSNERANIFFAAVEMTRMPMVVTDPNQPDNPIVFVNGAFMHLTGYQEQDVIGRNCRMLQGRDTDPLTIAEVRKAVQEQRAVAVDVLNYKANGQPFWNALFIGPVFDQDGKLLYFFSSQMDITERRMSQQACMQAQKMEAIGQLTAGMAHDFNNLLQIINGNLELALRTLGEQQAAPVEPMRRAQRAAMRAGRLTQQLLTFARKQRLEPKQVNLNSLVVEFSDMLVRTLGDKVNLRLDLRPGLPSCTLDPTHVEMALFNVLVNARDAMPHGGNVTVATEVVSDKEVTARLHLPPGQYVAICTTDTGQGMAPEVLRRAAEPFFSTKGPGTGLGLAMVYGFVQQSHGLLELESRPGEGTVVRMIFPVAARGQQSPLHASSDEGRDGQACILVVEDNDDVRELAESVLGVSGYDVLTAPSGESALALLDQHGDIDLLFTDVIMPGGMNGLQLVERVRQTRPGLPVLLTTGYMDEIPCKCGRDGSLDVLPKPYKHDDLLERVRTVLQGKKAA
jgi:PAS domain S-box-containing protein